MATTPTQAVPQNGPLDDDMFEQDLKDMLKDSPDLNDLSNNVQGGGGNALNSPNTYPGPQMLNTEPGPQLPVSQTATSIPRSHTVPPGRRPVSENEGETQFWCHPKLSLTPTGDSATSTIPLSSPERNGSGGPPPPGSAGVGSKLDTIKAWSINTYKCTRQVISEKLGKGSRTVDLELEAQIEALRDTQRKYANVLRLARALTNHFYHVVQTQRSLGDCFADLSQKNPELQNEFTYNADTQKALCKNGETLLGALNFFTSTVNTLCHKTMEDTLMTIKLYETARVEYDAYRSDMELMQQGPRDSTNIPRIEDAQRKFHHHKEKYDRLRGDVSIKLKFLEENKVKVMHKQLLLFHNAIAAYFSGNQAALEATLKQFNIKLKAPNTDKPSWLEQ